MKKARWTRYRRFRLRHNAYPISITRHFISNRLQSSWGQKEKCCYRYDDYAQQAATRRSAKGKDIEHGQEEAELPSDMFDKTSIAASAALCRANMQAGRCLLLDT
ncbi:hypothetical protein RvY_12457 [Ramazzottius varieornatus]|uniref:Uncharacterized protein n=1 Tax=Ramazzottius varieornatus TaxID=947166 RepID=A0A1D1VLV4_RAMVA|nr:hypothetical protein RvY_12457 [Ramazzottius varieornatus]